MAITQDNDRRTARLLGGLCALGVILLLVFLKRGDLPSPVLHLSMPSAEQEKTPDTGKKMVPASSFLVDAPVFWRNTPEAEPCPSRKPSQLLLLPHYVPLHAQIQRTLATWKACSGNPIVRRVIVIGPDHHHQLDAGAATLESGGYATPLGDVFVDVDIRSAFIAGGIRQTDSLFLTEHGVGVFPVFVKQAFPQATLTPLVISFRATQAEVGRVVEVLRPFHADPETLIILSADFSHYLSHPAADLNDRETEAALAGQDEVFFWSARDAYTDFGRGLWLALRLAGPAPFRLLKRMNSVEIGSSFANTTSFFFGWWEVVPEE